MKGLLKFCVWVAILVIGTIVTLHLTSCNEFGSHKKVKTENQDDTEIIEDKKGLKNSANIAERIIQIALKYQNEMSKFDRYKLNSLVKRFNKTD